MFDIALGIAYSLALLWLVFGTVYRMNIWRRARSRFNIVLAPAPKSRTGVVVRLFLELITFRSLARANRSTWLASLALHYGLLWLLIVHLRFVFDALPLFLLPFIRFSGWAAALMLVGLIVLLLRRLMIDRLRYISSPSDYLHLILLIAIVISGLMLKRIWPVNLHEVGEFLQGSLVFSWASLPDSTGLVLHLLLVLVLLLIFPISKLVNGIGVVFSPTFNQRDQS